MAIVYDSQEREVYALGGNDGSDFLDHCEKYSV